eukprot:Nitzschia sp. Nitz4//scaffold255_size41878//27289//28665//NITZ4_007408-RA/size41878-processed-gene-0.64-mRNA-1//-1//CDS//3329544380//8959//frame0
MIQSLQAVSRTSRRWSRQSSRSMAVYAVGEGWTGALTREHILDTIPGHYDEDTSGMDASVKSPVLIYPHDNVKSVKAGWGFSAILDTQGQVQLVGRPQDLINLFRMNRMPSWVRRSISQHVDPTETTMVGSAISSLIGFATGGDEKDEWEAARQLSLLHDWTPVDISKLGDSFMEQIDTSAGFLGMVGKTGTLYTMGVNNRGQCGTGKVTNNVWTPEAIQGIAAPGKQIHAQSEQEEPVVQVSLGFQHGYALIKSGKIYSWGKSNRGQLGREVDSDQEATARPIRLDDIVCQIAAGLHHGAALTTDNKVYIWGKNMSRKDHKPTDATAPEVVEGLPNNRVLQISCGSHHTAILLDDGSIYAVGVASDEAVPLLDPVRLLAPGSIELPVRQFDAAHDRTTVVDRDGQVLQMHLWKEESLRDFTAFTPDYVDALLDEGQLIRSIHRGWLHTLIHTEPQEQ